MAFQYRVRPMDEYEAKIARSSSSTRFIVDGIRMFQASKGENWIRIMPPSSKWVKAPHWGLRVYVHYGIGPDKGAVVCLQGQQQKPCPICQERIRADRAQNKELVQQLRVVERVLTFVLNRRDEAQGVLAYAMPKTLDATIFRQSKDRAANTWTFVDHPVEGYDVYFDKEGAELNTKYHPTLARSPTPVADKWLDWVEEHPIPEILLIRDYDEVLQIFEGRTATSDSMRNEEPRRRDEPEHEPPPRPTAARADRRKEPETREPETKEPETREPETREPEAETKEPDESGDVADSTESGERPRRRASDEEAAPRQTLRRPTSNQRATGKTSNGADDEPPFDPAPGKAHADEVRQRFLSKR